MKKDQVIESARKLFTQKGYKKVSMDDIAKEANVSKKTVYSYFSSKEDLFKFFINEELDNMRNIVEEAEKEKEFFEKLHQGIYKLIKYKNKSKFLKVITKEVMTTNDKVLFDAASSIDNEIRAYILRKVRLANEEGFINIDNPEITSFLIYKMYFALIFDWNDSNNKLDENIIADNILEILKNGLRKKA